MLVRLLLLVVMSVLPPVSQAMQEGLGGDGWLVPWVTFFRCASILQITTESVSHSMLCQLSNQYFFGDLSRSCCIMIRVCRLGQRINCLPMLRICNIFLTFVKSYLQQHNILKFGGGQAAPLPRPGGHRAPALLALARFTRGALQG